MRHLLVFTTVFFIISGCVTTSSMCGNDQRDWKNLNFPKKNYCSVPEWIPFSATYERANKSVCKVHDNNTGNASTMSAREADYRFLCDYIKHSDFPWGVRHATGYLSYITLRISAPTRPSAADLEFDIDAYEATFIDNH